MMTKVCSILAVAGILLVASAADAETIVFDFEDGTDQGFGGGFGDDASESFPIIDIGGSMRMEVLRNGGFQEAGHGSGSNPFVAIMNQAANNPDKSTISYDWYVDTSLSPGNYGSFLQLGTYINSGAGGYVQDFPGAGKDVELDGAQLASGMVFSGTVTENLTTKYGAIPATFLAQTFQRFGLIINGDGADATVYFDNITITAIPEPGSLILVGLVLPGLMLVRRKWQA